MFTVIMGSGRVGARVANELSRAGHEVTILDINGDAFRRLDVDFAGNTLIGNGIDSDVLRRAGIERADAFIAATQGDNRNIMASQVALHIFNVPTVVARIYDPLRQETFELLGIQTISPTVMGANAFLAVLLEGEEPNQAGGGTSGAAPST
ncbi:MAG: trk/ktr system potassium uptake protein [Chloroflexota bacterium]|jgi:trk system potassium uptake protein TrkA|nr:trk/ktr system potassium uptake protein [Chloroflexota bacterium]